MLSGAEKRRRRVAKGLPPLTATEAEGNRRRFAANGARLRALTDAIKLERGCADCGYRGHPAALDFDHLPGMGKKNVIGRMHNYSRESLEGELDKCEVVCSNCHRIRTVERRRKADPALTESA